MLRTRVYKTQVGQDKFIYEILLRKKKFAVGELTFCAYIPVHTYKVISKKCTHTEETNPNN